MTLEVAMRLQNLRKQSGYSQEELAEKIGVSRQAISKWERAEASPDTDNLIALASLYNVSLDELIGLNAEKQTNEESETTQESQEETADNAEENDEEQKEEFHFVSDDGDTVHIDSDGIHIENEDEDQVHIGINGIHVDSEDGDHVHIDKDGIHIDSADGEHVHIGADGKIIEGVNVEYKRRHTTSAISGIISGVTVFGSVIAYILLGSLCGLWHPAWIIFLAIPVVPSLFDAIVKGKPSHFAYPVFITAVYLILGSVYGWWHPAWVVFLTIPVYYMIADFFKRK